ncbi:MAG: hypothetical protein ACE5G9_08760 [Nitrospinales bacterium]
MDRVSLPNLCHAVVLFVFISLLPPVPTAFADPGPQEKLKLLKTQLIRNIKAKNHTEVLRLVGEIRKLGIPLADTVPFIEGRALLFSGKPGKARVLLETYIHRAGVKGKFYKQARRLLKRAKTRQRKLRETAVGKMTEEEKKRFAEQTAKNKAGIARCDKQYRVCARVSQREYKVELDAQLSTETKVKTAGERILECRAVRDRCYEPFED